MVQLRIATWNIGGGLVSTDRPLQFDTEDLGYVAASLQALGCDIACLQEIQTPVNPAQARQAEQLARMIPMPYWFTVPYGPHCQSPFQEDQQLSLAILSHWEILSTRYELLPNPRLQVRVASGEVWTSHDKGFLSAQLAIGGARVAVVTGHTNPFELFGRQAHEAEFAPINRAMEELLLSTLNRPTLVTGDFNYDTVERLLPRVFQAGYRRALPPVATEPRYGHQRDHILVSPHWVVRCSEALPGRADHFLCYADVVLKE